MTREYEDTALATREEQSFEIAPNANAAGVAKQIEVAMVVAQRLPRDEDKCRIAIMKACQRPRFAEDVNYAFQRGKKKDPQTGRMIDNIISGLSISFCREAARLWGNIIYQQKIVSDTPDSVTIQGTAWDLQTNTQSSVEATIPKLVKRATGDKVPSARELMELVNMTGSKLKRNAILDLLPADLKEECTELAEKTKIDDAKKNPAESKRKLLEAFQSINISVEMLETYLQHSVDNVSAEEIAKLRGIYKAVKDGTPWTEYVKPEAVERQSGTLNVEELTPGGENRGHGNDDLGKVKVEAAESELSEARSLLLDAQQACIDAGVTAKAIKDTLELFGGTVETLSDFKCEEAAAALMKKAKAAKKF